MKVFTSATEQGAQKVAIQNNFDSVAPFLWNLMSYFYVQGDEGYAELIRDNSRLVMIDSGAHSFQKGKKVDWKRYTEKYADFIRRFDKKNVIGYFEMDVDNLIGYEGVLNLRSILEKNSGHPDKIIPVWHKNRGIDNYLEMCERYAGKIVAIPGFRSDEIKDEQFPMFVKAAHKHGCKVHCLGMTRKSVLDKVPFDYTDSSSWAHSAIFGKVGNARVSKGFSKTNRDDVFIACYKEAMKMQVKYYEKWKKVAGDDF